LVGAKIGTSFYLTTKKLIFFQSILSLFYEA